MPTSFKKAVKIVEDRVVNDTYFCKMEILSFGFFQKGFYWEIPGRELLDKSISILLLPMESNVKE